MTLGKPGGAAEPDYFYQPNDVIVAPNGDIFVSEGHGAGNNRVLKFTKDGKLIKSWGKLGTGPGEFDQPHALAFDSKGRLYVGDRNNNRIQVFDQDGKYISEMRQFSRPSGIFIDKNDMIYVADSESVSVSRNHDGWKRGIRMGSLKDGKVVAFIPDPGGERSRHQRGGRRRGGRCGQHLRRGSGSERFEEIRQTVSMQTRREALGLIGAAVWQGIAYGADDPKFPKGAIIRTILKDLPPEALTGGATLFHEHLSLAPDFMPRWIALARPQQAGKANPTPPAIPQPFFMQDLDLMSGELRTAAQEGVACIVDGGHPDMGRDLDFLKQLSVKSGMPIVAGCGYYSQPFYPPEIATMTEDEIVRELVRQANTQRVGAYGEIGSWAAEISRG